MKKWMRIFLGWVGLAVLAVVTVVLLTPWMDRWGATEAELQATYPGDELVTAPKSFVNHAVTINASPEQIYPWLVQMGADKAGLYSYTALENMIACSQTNADRIHDEWQNLQVGDLVRLCPKDPGPPPYIVAQLVPNQAIVMGHKENGEWVDLWQFVITPQADGTSRLVLRTRTMAVGGFWDVIHPGVFIMERGLLLGVKERAEKMAQGK
jgi:hypothetical protein